MNKLLIASLIAAASLLAACGKPAEAPKANATKTEVKADAAAATVTDAPKAEEAKPQVVAPKPPPPPGGGKSAPELKPEDIARIQEMLKQRSAEAAAPAAAKK